MGAVLLKSAAMGKGVFLIAAFLSTLVLVLVLALALPAKADFVGHGAPVRDVVISSDGDYAASAGFDDIAILWSVRDRRQIARFYGHEAGVNAVAFLPAASGATHPRIVSVSDDGTARIWDGDTGVQLYRLDGHDKKVVAVAVSPDGTRIATASWDRTVRLWDSATGREIAVFGGHENSVNDLQFNAAGDAVYSAGYDGDIRVWPLDAAVAPYRFARVGFPINGLALSGDGRTLVTGSADQAVRVWDIETRALRRELTGIHDGAVLSVAITPDGGLIASGGVGGTLLLWDSGDNPKVTMQVPHYRAVWALAFSPDSRTIYAAGIDAVVRGWETETGQSVIGETTRFQPVERASSVLATSEDPVERGSYQFRKCAICHALDADAAPRSGPTLAGIFGRRAGSLPEYDYSDVLRDSAVIWDAETIAHLFDIGPNRMFPGTKMPEQRLGNQQDRSDLVEYLRQATE